MNSAAGSVKGADDSARSVADAFARQGMKATIRQLPGPLIAAAAREFVDLHSSRQERPDEALAVAGGDGTISAVAGVVAGTGIPLGILPLGTLNHFAKDLGLPLEVDAAVGIIASGRSRTVDVAELNGRVFVNNSSVGIYPFMVERRNAHQQRHGIGKVLATLPALLDTLRGASWHRLYISAAGKRQRIRTPCVFVGNNSYEVDLKALGTRTRLDGGELDVHVVRQQSRLGVLLLPIKIALGIVDPRRDVQTFRSAELEIVSRHRGSLRVSLDGEVVRMETPLRYRSRPDALRVFCGPKSVPPPA
jgi:diacylglycerol kinase family enzyme